MKQKRTQLTSLSERVQNLTLRQQDGLFYELQSQSATFKWQKPDQFYGDVTGPMICVPIFGLVRTVSVGGGTMNPPAGQTLSSVRQRKCAN